jgi:predicted  nucleic acid-binding Zn-ribbon protein
MLFHAIVAVAATGAGRSRRDLGDVRNQVTQIQARIQAMSSAISNTDDMNADAMNALTSAVQSVGPALANIDTLVADLALVQGEMDGIQDQVDSELDAQSATIHSTLDAVKVNMEALVDMEIAKLTSEVDVNITEAAAANEEMVAPIGERVTGYQGAIGTIADSLKLTHYMNNKVPVYRWNFWHTYNYCCLGWYDGNNPRSFGGVRPSQWGDDNANADWIHPEMKYIKRLFSRQGYGDKDHGATVCAETRMIPHSTDDFRCGVVFRIRNTNSGNTNWRMDWTFTGWSGWGGRASCAVNKRNIWHGSCHGTCSRTENVQINSNGKRNMLNTVIFIAGNAHPYGHYNHMKTTILMFNNLNLPNGLEFVDDLSTVPGNHRWDRDN